MRKIIITILLIIGIAVSSTLIVGHADDTSDYMRIHIRANSNTEIDQDVKYIIKGEVVKLLTPQLERAKNADEAKCIVRDNIENINNVANKVLRDYGMDYVAHSDMRREHFPVRHYGNVTLEEGDYDALIVELGEARGDNWWCVVFPPLCFVESESVGSGRVEYVSKIAEWLDKIRK